MHTHRCHNGVLKNKIRHAKIKSTLTQYADYLKLNSLGCLAGFLKFESMNTNTPRLDEPGLGKVLVFSPLTTPSLDILWLCEVH